MSKSQKTSIFSRLLKKNKSFKKLTLTLIIVFLYRFCNTIPLGGIDQEALKQAFSQVSMNNSVIQILNMYSGGGGGITPWAIFVEICITTTVGERRTNGMLEILPDIEILPDA